MINFICDWCSNVKREEEVWILGHAAEAVGVTSARREVNILSGWDWEHAVDPLAVHFCSVECKDKYMAKLFAPQGAVEDVIVERAVPAKVVVEHLAPAKKVAKVRAAKSGRRRRVA